jgi:uncharacterized protein (DUF302 family)
VIGKTLAVVLLLLQSSDNAFAAERYAPVDGTYRLETDRPFPEVVNSLQFAIEDTGNRVLHLQRIDVGLRAAGYPCEPYRIVFYSPPDMQYAIEHDPTIAVFLPLTITIYADGNKTRLVALSPLALGVKGDSRLWAVTTKWDRGLRAILARLDKGL